MIYRSYSRQHFVVYWHHLYQFFWYSTGWCPHIQESFWLFLIWVSNELDWQKLIEKCSLAVFLFHGSYNPTIFSFLQFHILEFHSLITSSISCLHVLLTTITLLFFCINYWACPWTIIILNSCLWNLIDIIQLLTVLYISIIFAASFLTRKAMPFLFYFSHHE